ncbi:5'-nucleotidase [Cellulosimicrobium cellulans]|uniref:5'-nucleotidase n=1 Tax=Cellulosimicrobium cellulans TaxID=1710 RepID=UPI00130D7EA5|nr:5'-nucleotidase [Cellulosimicrobium cellulans]
MAEYNLFGKLVVGITPSALFDVRDSHDAFRKGLDEYRAYQDEHIDDPLPPGVAFPFVKRLLGLNDLRPGDALVEVIVLAKDDATTGLRIMKSIAHYELDITRAVFTEGKAPYQYIDALNICLFLSGNAADAVAASAAGYPAGQVLGRTAIEPDADDPDSLLVALDFDRVLADNEAEEVYNNSTFEEYLAYESENAGKPLGDGPMKQFLVALGRIQEAERQHSKDFTDYRPRVRLALVTARQAPAHERAVRTLRHWNVQVNDAFFLGGVRKAHVLSVLRPHIYFDDQPNHLEHAQATVASVLVPFAAAPSADADRADFQGPATGSLATPPDAGSLETDTDD